MPRNTITPLIELTSRPPEAGRIRLGVKSGKAMKSIDTFRFTSPHQDVIEQLAELYGGQARPWNEPRANPSNQFEVITTAKEIPVYLHPDGLSSWYEMWSAGGCQRRCDGITCATPIRTGEGFELADVDCMCIAQGMRLCEPHTRMAVLIPQVQFRGVWRLETKGWNALAELPGMFELIEQLSAGGSLVQARLGVARREQMVANKKKNYVVPYLMIDQTLLGLQQGLAAAALGAGPGVQTTQVAIGTGTVPIAEAMGALPATTEAIDVDEIDDELLDLEEKLRNDARQYNLDPDRFLQAITVQVAREKVGDDVVDCDFARRKARLAACHAGVLSEKLVPIGFTPQGAVQWRQ